jgi:hypothetical protein
MNSDGLPSQKIPDKETRIQQGQAEMPYLGSCMPGHGSHHEVKK